MSTSPTHCLKVAVTCLTASLILLGCAGGGRMADRDETMPPRRDAPLEINLIQLNDVYEITPLAGGSSGGLARVATIRDSLLRLNPHTFTLLAGDFLSPSALGTAKVDGERLAGKHMVDVMNAVGVDMVTLGNHEFDLDEDQLLDRIAESGFEYISGNVRTAEGDVFPGVKPYKIVTVSDGSGRSLRLGVLGVTADIVPVDYVSYLDHIQTIQRQIEMLEDSVDAFVAMTHLFLAQDIELANEAPELSLIVGGHDHENLMMLRGPAMVPIAKADANAASVIIHTMSYDFDTETLEVQSRIMPITDAIPAQAKTDSVVHVWLTRAWEGFRASGFEPEKVVARATASLDGRESSVRTVSTRLTQIMADGMRRAAGDVDVVVFNSGGIRIDDVIPPGRVTQYDVIRILPFGGVVMTVEMSGNLLDSVLTQGLANRGSGGFLQTDGVRSEGGIWFTDDGALLPGETYRVAINDFLLSGRETNFEFLTLDHPEVREIATHGDIRFAVIEELRRRYPPQ